MGRPLQEPLHAPERVRVRRCETTVRRPSNVRDAEQHASPRAAEVSRGYGEEPELGHLFEGVLAHCRLRARRLLRSRGQVRDAFEELFYAAPVQFPSESREGVGSGGYARGAWDAPWDRDGEVVNATRGLLMCLRSNGLEEEDCHVYIHTN